MDYKAHKLIADDGEEITVMVPDPLDLTPPPDYAVEVAKSCFNKENWKYPTEKFFTTDKTIADNVAEAFDWFLGGHESEVIEMGDNKTLYHIGSAGYYFYIGA